MSDAIAIHELNHTYLAGLPGQTQALRDASLSLTGGAISALVGPSGAGKSTLVYYANGLLRPNAPGQVSVLGVDTGEPDCDMTHLRRSVGLVFQQPHHQLFERFVADDVAFGPLQMDLDENEVWERVEWAMEAVGLDYERFADRPTFGLSGGEMRRVAIAGVLASRPKLLVLDEVTTGLDPEGKALIHALLRRLRDQEDVTVLICSNDLDEVALLADEATLLFRGRTMLAGKTRDVLRDSDALVRASLGSTVAANLAYRLERAGLPIKGDPVTLAEGEEAIWQALTH